MDTLCRTCGRPILWALLEERWTAFDRESRCFFLVSRPEGTREAAIVTETYVEHSTVCPRRTSPWKPTVGDRRESLRKDLNDGD